MATHNVTVGDEQAFWFKDWNGNVVFVAHNIKEFKKALKAVPNSCLEFHLREDKNDFSAWLESVMNQKAVSERIQAVKALNLKGEKLRKSLLRCFRPMKKIHKRQHSSKSLREALLGK